MSIRPVHLVIGLSLAAVLTAAAALTTSLLAQDVSAQSTPTLALDMDTTNGSGPCNPVDNVRSINSGDTYQVAICLSNSPAPPAAFQLDLKYNDDLNQCIPSDCSGTTCLDGNPDANAGSTTFGGTDLGAGWDCNIMQVQGPACDRDPGSGKGHGDALIICNTLDENPALAVGDGVSSPIAVLNFKSVGDGSDTMTLEEVEVDNVAVKKIVDPLSGNGAVVGGSVSTEGVPPTLTPAATTTPAATSTPNPIVATATAAAAATAIAQGTPVETLDQAATATSVAAATKAAASTPSGKATAKPGATTEDNGGSSGPNAGLIAGIVIVVVIVAGGAGWFAWRRMRAT